MDIGDRLADRLEKTEAATVAQQEGLQIDFVDEFSETVAPGVVIDTEPQIVEQVSRAEAEAAEASYESLDKYSLDLTRAAEEGRLDPARVTSYRRLLSSRETSV